MPANGIHASLPEGALQCCPTCGCEIAEDSLIWDLERGVFVANGRAARFSRRQAQMFDVLWRMRFKGGVPSIERFMTMVFCDEIDGGPESSSVISVQLNHIRTKLQGTGYSITLNCGRPRRGFRLVSQQENGNG